MIKYKKLFTDLGVRTEFRDVELDECISNGDEVFFNGGLIGYYMRNGFRVVSFYRVKHDAGLSKSSLFSITFSFLYLNQELPFDDTVLCLTSYFNELSGVEGMEYSKEYVEEIVEWCISNLDEDKLWEKKYFYWTGGRYALSSSELKSAMRIFLNKDKKVRNLNLFYKHLTVKIDGGDEFITPKSFDIPDMSLSSVKRYFNLFKDDIDKHNKRKFSFTNYRDYQRELSIKKINEAVKRMGGESAKPNLSRRQVASEAGLHFNTVQKLWNQI